MKLEVGKAPATPDFPADPALDGAIYSIARVTQHSARCGTRGPKQRVALTGGGDEVNESSKGKTEGNSALPAETGTDTEPKVEPRSTVLATRKALRRKPGLDRVAVGGSDAFAFLWHRHRPSVSAHSSIG